MTVLLVPDDGPDIVWPTLGPQVADWIEDHLVFGPGDLRGEPAVVDDEKYALLCRMYEVYPEDHPDAGRRRFKRAGISVPKGLAKTEFAAWIAAAELHAEAPVRTIGWREGVPIGSGVRDPYIPMVAYTEEQSDELAYGALRMILEHSRVAHDFDIGLERVMRIHGDGKAVSLSAAPSARDGARTTFQLADETHWWTRDKLRKAHQTMLANIPKRRLADAWALEVTTAFEPGAGSVAESTMDYARAIAEGRAEDARLFFFHRQASDDWDLETEEGARGAVMEATGPTALGWRDVDGIVELWRDPTTDRRYWERVWCNRPTQSGDKAFSVSAWRSLEQPREVARGSRIVAGFDGALFRDATAIVCTEIETGYTWLAGAWECPFGQEGKWRVPEEEVELVLEELFERFTVWRVYCDPPYWQSQIAAWQAKYGDDRVIEWWTNRRRQMAHALENFETAINDGTIPHDGAEVLDRHIGNAHTHELPYKDEENRPLWLIRKESSDSPNKIDAAMAAVLSWEARTDAIAAGLGDEDERVFSKKWIQYYTEAPTGGGNRYLLVYAANDKKPDPEWSTMWALELRSDRNYYALELVRAKLTVEERVDLLFDWHRRYDPIRVGYDRRGYEIDLELIKERRRRENYRFPVVQVKDQRTDNECILRLVPLFEAERIVLPERYDYGGEDMVDLFVRREYAPFPVGAHSDMLAGLSRILDIRAVFPSSAVRKATPTVFPSDF